MPRLHLEGLSEVVRGDDPNISAVDYVLCNGDTWPHLKRAELLQAIRELGRRVIADAKGTEP